MKLLNYDVLIAGAGVAGLNCALHLPAEKRVLIVCKGGLRQSDSFLAQGGICVLRDREDFAGYFEDTMRAGHYENDPETVRCMIEHSRETIVDLIESGVRFEREQNGELSYTREGAHSRPRILYHADCTGKEITSRLLKQALKQKNIRFLPHTTLLDLICASAQNTCYGGILRDNRSGELFSVRAQATVLATGGIGGLFRHSTNYRLLTGDGLAMCLRHGVAVDYADYVQIHPTTLYTKGRGRKFLISESARGEGARLLDKRGNRFVDELLPRDKVTQAIYDKMKEEGSEYVRLDLRSVAGGEDTLKRHFPGIVKRCFQEGYNVFEQPIPVVPAQHYFMGGIRSDLRGRTTMNGLYAVGETCCNGVHGKNRLASNSLLESLLFAKRAAQDIGENTPSSEGAEQAFRSVREAPYTDWKRLEKEYKQNVLKEIHRDGK